MQKTVVKTENPVEFTDNGMNKYTSLQIINCQEQSDSRGRSTKKWITVSLPQNQMNKSCIYIYVFDQNVPSPRRLLFFICHCHVTFRFYNW